RSCGNTTDTNPTTSIGTASARKVTVSPAASASGPATIRPTGPEQLRRTRGHPGGTPAGQNPTPFVGEAPFRPPTFNPVNGSMVGVAKPIYITFAV
ncbi:hypothetical protein H7H37_09035, partial [Mycolicibacterium insubricum]|nr:hypothetical protein [Mycolicibacterium insubricum]